MTKSMTFPPESQRRRIAEVLHDHGACTLEFICDTLVMTPPAARAALYQGRMAGVFARSAEDSRWRMTPHGHQCWQRRDEQGQNVTASPALLPTDALSFQRMTGAGYTRFMGTGDRLPQVLRPGSMDFAQHPRISGPYRVWPDGRRERIDAANDGGVEAA